MYDIADCCVTRRQPIGELGETDAALRMDVIALPCRRRSRIKGANRQYGVLDRRAMMVPPQ